MELEALLPHGSAFQSALMDMNIKSRRSFLKGSAIAGAAYLIGSPVFAGSLRASVIVVGAGAFGGWSALQLLRKGAKVTLLDAWGPGNSRASSGGETSRNPHHLWS
jgi:hypothetical protein